MPRRSPHWPPPLYSIVAIGLIAALAGWWLMGTAEMMQNAPAADPLSQGAALLQEARRVHGLEDLPADAFHAMIGRAGPDRPLLDLYLLLFTELNKEGAFDIRRFNIHARRGRVRPADAPLYFREGTHYTVPALQAALLPGLHLRLHVDRATGRHGMGVDTNPAVAAELAALAAANLESITGRYPPPLVLDKLVPLEQLRAQEALVARFPRYEEIPSIELLELLQKNPGLSDLGLRLRYAAAAPPVPQADGL